MNTTKELADSYNSFQEWLGGKWRLDSTGKPFMINDEESTLAQETE